MDFSNTYIHLGSQFYQRLMPTKVSRPSLQLFNQELANQLGMSFDLTNNSYLLAQYFSGNELISGSEPIALAYSGHQFGHFNPQLGDGRAHLLGEIIATNKQRYDVQLKGSGPTIFSRQGDGRCAIGPAVREFIMSEAMHAMGVPTSRCLAVVASGDTVYRESPLPGAVVTRIASSHIRVGTFQYFAAKGDTDSLKVLTQYAIDRHFPTLTGSLAEQALQFIDNVIAQQIILISKWMSVGFIHGVMNTDNTAICGETIDFGPCAMMSTYRPDTVFSSIDRHGRYAYSNQPKVTQWNMARLAETLLPLIDDDQDTAVAKVEPLIVAFTERYERAYDAVMAKKIGFSVCQPQVKAIVVQLLELMQQHELDFTNTFIALSDRLPPQSGTVSTVRVAAQSLPNSNLEPLSEWIDTWLALLETEQISTLDAQALMHDVNPLVIPRNHHMERVLAACEESGNCRPAEQFLQVVRSPFKTTEHTHKYQDAPLDGDQNYHTFCGT